MKNLTLSVIATLALTTFAVAESYPAYGVDSYKAQHDSSYNTEAEQSTIGNTGIYVGIAYGLMNVNAQVDASQPERIETESDYDLNMIMLQAGYKFNQYIAVEGRYWFAFGDIDYTFTSSTHPWANESGSFDSDDEDAYAFYIKPMYPIATGLDIYALLGYASIDDIEEDDSGFSWGLGFSYNINDNIAVFVDYTKLYDDDATDELMGYRVDADISSDSWNFGINYKF
jgi:opacity protein-like surface antigen